MMRTVCVGWTLLAMVASVAAQDRILWAPSLDQARELAARQHRMVLVHFWDENCPPCMMVERRVFNHPDVIRAFSVNYVPFKANVRELSGLARQMRIESVPTDVILTPDGKELFRGNSTTDSNRYIALLDQVAAHGRLGIENPAISSPGIQESPFASQQSSRTSAFQAQSFPPQYAVDAGPQPGPPGEQGFQGAQWNRFATPAASGYRNDPGGFSPAQTPMPAAPTQSPGYPGEPAAAGSPGPGGQSPAISASPTIGPLAQSPTTRPAASNWDGGGAWRDSQAGGPTDRSPEPAFGPEADRYSQEPTGGGAAAAEPPLAIDGCCPVTLMSMKKWKPGDRRWGAVHRGRLYLFAGPDEQRAFWEEPDRYSPMLSGFDPVQFAEQRQLVAGKRQHGVFYFDKALGHDKVFLFADEASLARFWQSPQRYAALVDEAVRQADRAAAPTGGRRY